MDDPVTAVEEWLIDSCPTHEEGMQTIDNLCHLMAAASSVQLRARLKKAIQKIQESLRIEEAVQLPD